MTCRLRRYLGLSEIRATATFGEDDGEIWGLFCSKAHLQFRLIQSSLNWLTFLISGARAVTFGYPLIRFHEVGRDEHVACRQFCACAAPLVDMDGAKNNPLLANMQLHKRAGNQKHNLDGLDHRHSPLCEPQASKSVR